MKKTIITLLCAFAALICNAAEKPKLVYTDASQFTVVNKAQDDGLSLKRLDTDKYPDLTPRVRYFYNFPTGMALRFHTNSRTIDARWETNDSLNGNNNTAIMQKGFDLYIKRDGKWLYAGPGRPKYTGTQHKHTIVTEMDTTMKECMLYLPLYSLLKKIEIGTEPGSIIEASVVEPRSKVVFMGSSLTHGIGANRPGMTFAAILGRRWNVDTPNLGASGQCKLEQFYAKIICDTEADMFVFDTFSNPSAEQINERLLPFIETIRKCHPNTPLVFLQTILRETSNFNQKLHKFETDKRNAAIEQMRIAMSKYKDVFFINPGISIGSDHEATVDGTHPTDLGTMRVVENIQSELEEIMYQYNIPFNKQ